MSVREDLLKRRAELSAGKQALLQKRLKRVEIEDAPPAIPSISKRSPEALIPLSFAQERLWFIQELEPDNPFYNELIAMRMSGPVDLPALASAVDAVVQRHELLRTTFARYEGQVVQHIEPVLPAHAGFPLIDFQAIPLDRREEEIQRCARQYAQQPFHLTDGVLWRMLLLRVSPTQHVMVVVVHHLICDGWSMSLFMRDLAVCYAAACEGEQTALPELPFQYADYVLWQRQWLQGPVQEQQLAYWRKQLSGLPPMLELPTDRPRPPVTSYQGGRLAIHVPHSLHQALNALAQREGMTLFMLLATALAILLERYSHQEDIAIGTPIAGRAHDGLEELFGLFLNTLVIRADLSGDPTIQQLLRRVRAVALDAYAHQDLPFEKLVEELHPQRSLSHSPFFQVTLGLQHLPDSQQIQHMAFTPFNVDNGRVKFELTLLLQEKRQELSGELEYNGDLWDAVTMQRFLARWLRILQAMVQDLQQRLSQVALLDDQECHQLLEAWNATVHALPEQPFVHLRLQEQAERAPDAVALVSEKLSLTYAELNERANQLAHRLHACGVGPEVLVGVYMERSVEQMLSIVAILKAGGAYVPLDPSYPPERIAYMLQDSAAPVLLTLEPLRSQLPAYNGQVLYVDCDASLETQSRENLLWQGTVTNAMYVLYTSGSTGTPKGSVNAHQSIYNYLHWQIEMAQITAQDRVLLKTPANFDAAAVELFTPLMVGATQVIARPEGHRDSAYLVKTLREQQISLTHFVPSMLQLLLEEPGVEQCQSLRYIVSGGEVLSPQLLKRFSSLLNTRVHNHYGPTETSVTSTAWFAEPDCDEQQVPIGRPVFNTEILLLDRHLRLVPVGVVGELYIGGIGLARGYLGQPALTADRFVPHPFVGTRFSASGASEPGARLYKTGDLARYRSDGVLEYLGRIDGQIKLRGMRVELGEIESVLRRHPAIQEAAIIVQQDGQIEPRLVAYLVPASGQPQGIAPTDDDGPGCPVGAGLAPALEFSEIRRFLQRELPAHMVPAVFVELESFPLTPNGKLDRRALPAPEQGQVVHQGELVAPRTATEEELVTICSQLLGLEQISMTDNFFVIGGHSLLATRLLFRIQQSFQVELPLRRVFEIDTLAELATDIDARRQKEGVIDSQQQMQNRQFYDALRSMPRPEHLPLSFAQQRLWFLDQLVETDAAYIVSLAMRISGPLHKAALQAALSAILSRHEVLRTTFDTVEGEPVQLIHPYLELPLIAVPLRGETPAAREQEALAHMSREASTPFNLQEGPLLRALLYPIDAQVHLFLLVQHHIITDAWSSELFFKELLNLYQGYATGMLEAVPELPLWHYADYALWQRHWLQGVQQRLLDYWREQLAGAPDLLELPTDYPRPPMPSHRGGQVPFVLSKELSEALYERARQEGVTLFMLLLTSFSLLLAQYSQQEDLVIGSPIAGRTHPDAEELLGLFVNTLALRIDLRHDPSVAELLQRVRTVALDAYAHQDLPFEQLIEALRPDQIMGRNPLFQAMFVLHSQEVPTSLPSGPTITPLSIDNGSTKIDLTLLVKEQGSRLSGFFEYSSDLWKLGTIERFLDQWQYLLQVLVTVPACQRLSLLPLLQDHEQRQLLEEWNATSAPLPEQPVVHRHIEAMAARTPQATALLFGEQSLSYRQLNEQANQLAHHLHACGVGPEVLVGVYMERSVELIVSLLAILKAGGAYVPLDPAYPPGRIAYIVEHAGLTLVLTDEQLCERVPAQVHRLCPRLQAATIARQSTGNPTQGVMAEQLAYVIYTSGSTGTPKGVMISHQGLFNYLSWASECYQVAAGNGSVVHSSLAFDLTVTALFPALLHGKAVVLLPEERAVEHLAEAMRQGQQLSLLKITPAHLDLLNQLVLPQELAASANALVIGGEALRAQSVEPWRRFAPATRLINEYGPTETVVGCCIYEVTAEDGSSGELPIGRPIANTTLYVLDQHRRPVPIGVPGELYIGGLGVARGYVQRPELTAERFLPDPYGGAPGGRLYRTGDLARYRADGVLEFLGRVDHQIKLRGYRIELGEIETVLVQHPAIGEAAVMVQQEEQTEPRLVAYLVPSQQTRLEFSEIRAYLHEQLPAYMVPAVFVALERLPLTTNGKLDRRALPAPEQGQAVHQGEQVAPRTATEERLVVIWSQLLGLEQISVTDNFFVIGGHSLLATRLLFRIQQSFQIELPLRRIFEIDTLAELAADIDVRQQVSNGGSSLIQPLPRPEHLPLSFAQQRLWFLDQLLTNKASYIVAQAFCINGPLHKAALQAALSAIMARHEVLRTTFDMVEGEPVQLIHPYLELPLIAVPLRGETPAAREQEALAHMNQEVSTPFNLQEGPLLRALLYPIDAQVYLFLLVQHHMITDAWSCELFFKELLSLYQSSLDGTLESVVAAPLWHYADYALWQRHWLQGAQQQRLLDYWREQLAGAPDLLELPTDYPRPPMPSHRGGLVPFVLPDELAESLYERAQQEGVTLFMLLLASFSLLLAQYSQQEDLVIGSPIAGRTQAQWEQMLGLFVNTLALRVDLSNDPTVAELLQRVRGVALGAYEHQDLPFEHLVEALRPVQVMGRNPLFQAMFVLQNRTNEVFEQSEVTITALPISNGGAKVDLTLQVEEQEGQLLGYFEYNSDLWHASTIERFCELWQRVLQAMSAEPQRHLSELSLLSPQEYQQLVTAWNATSAPLPEQPVVHRHIEAMAARTPQATALLFEEQSLSYRQLNERANQLAHHLHACGVGPEVLVGVYMERSVEQIVSLLAILKAGGAYVPLDPAYPQGRIAYIVENAGLTLVLTDEQLCERLPAQVDRLCPRLQAATIAQQRTDNPVCRTTAEQLAYVIYTSGSTGTPKGVMISHQGLFNYLSWASECYQVAAGNGSVVHSSLAFDLTVTALFPALLHGKAVVLLPEERAVEHLAETMRQGQQFSLLKITPAHLDLLNQFLLPQELAAAANALVIGGEALRAQSVEPWRRFAPATRLINEYGPTETVVGCCIYEVTAEDGSSGELPIGRPIANTTLYVLDQHRRPVPIGVPGELYIGGLGVARGYVQRPELTAERFLPDPYGGTAGSRLYRTGDLARYRADGVLEFLGRVDHQVKLRGYRIELGEIETVLVQHPAIGEAAVIVHQDEQIEPRLVAYLVSSQQEGLEFSEVRAYLHEQLPAYMVPAVFVELERLPLTTNGKLDRRALPAPEQGQVVHQGEQVAPRTATEERLVVIWSQLLGLEQVSIEDDFFVIGGHSLLAMRLMMQLREQFSIDFSLRNIFEASTLAGMARMVDEFLAGNVTSTTASDERAWYEDAVLDPAIRAGDLQLPAHYQLSSCTGIFLTGATGFLGAHLLFELLQQTRATIYCLVRADSMEQGRRKLYQQLNAYQLWQETIDASKIVPVPGDLGSPLFGLSVQEFYQLAGQIQVIYHNGASVNIIAPYPVLRGANVLGTQEVLRLASTESLKPVHYVSTISVLATSGNDEALISEQVPLDPQRDYMTAGYSQSKWNAEKLVQQALERGIPVCIYRPGRISGHTSTGVWNPDDYLCRIIRGCIQLGGVPDVEEYIDMTPVDYLSQAIVHLSQHAAVPGKVFHLFNPVPATVAELVAYARSFGYQLERPPYNEWRARVQQAIQEMPEHAFAPILTFFPEIQSPEEESGTGLHTMFMATNTRAGLADMMPYPSINEQLIHAYLSFLLQKGLLPSPSLVGHE